MKRKKTGFTLIELIAVILILAIIAMIVIPSVLKIVEEAKIGAFKETNQNIAESIANKCSSEFLLGKNAIYDYELTGGLIMPDIDISGKLPTNGTIYVNSDCKVTLATNNNKYCAIKYEDDEKVYVGYFVEGECIIDGVNASLYLDIGNEIDIVEIGENYEMPIAIARDIHDNNISDKIIYTITLDDVEIDAIDTSVLAEYEILYKISANKMTLSKIKTVKVVDTTIPVITGADDVTIYSYVSTFDLLEGVSAYDNSGEEVEIITSGNLTLGIEGEYEITYTVTDSSGNQVSIIRTITVSDKSYDLTLDTQGGTISNSVISVFHDSKYGNLEVPIKTGFTFLGWYTAAIDGTKIISTMNIINSDHTLYAHWTPINNYAYTGSYQTFVAPLTGTYLFETWGAQGGASNNSGGKGAYASGKLSLVAGATFYVFVGQSPTTATGGYNGGGNTGASIYTYGSRGGGGATDIRTTNANAIYDQRRRIMVAAGGGGGQNGGYGGTLTGGAGVATSEYLCLDGVGYASYDSGCIFRITEGGLQTRGGIGGIGSVNSYPYMYNNWSRGETGSWYKGADNSSCTSNQCSWSCGGGGGWYGGGGGANSALSIMGGGGGSSFVSGYTGCQAVNEDMQPIGSISLTGISFTNPVMIAGNSSMPNYLGTGTITGNSGNGYAKISFIP